MHRSFLCSIVNLACYLAPKFLSDIPKLFCLLSFWFYDWIAIYLRLLFNNYISIVIISLGC
jgi:hypothetical protein